MDLEAGFHGSVTFQRSESITYERMLPEESYFNFIFTDGDHSYEVVRRGFLAYFPRLNVGDVILLHDTNPKYRGSTMPRRLINEMLVKTSHASAEEIKTQPNFGMAIVRKLSDVTISFTQLMMLGIKPRQIRYAMTGALRNSNFRKVFTSQIMKPPVVSLRRYRARREH